MKTDDNYKKTLDRWLEDGYKLRYSGCMAADMHHLFSKGDGLFIYPATQKSPQGKLRLLFECNPLSFLAEQAGGAASSGAGDILDVEIAELHQRTPIFIGSKKEVKKVVGEFGRP